MKRMMIQYSSTISLNREDQFAYWADGCKNDTVSLEAISPQREFFGRSKHCAFGGFALMHIETGTSHRVIRSFKAEERAERGLIGVHLAGTASFSQDGREVDLHPGDIFYYDSRRPFQYLIGQTFEQFVLQCPLSQVSQRISGLGKLTAVPIRQSDIGNVFINFLRSLLDGLKATDDVLEQLGSQAIDLFALSLQQYSMSTDISHPRDAMLCRVKRFIEGHLQNPHLSPDMVGAAMGVSSRYIQGILRDEENTSLMRYVWSRRVELCRHDLEDPMQDGKTISEIAFVRGFNSLSHFVSTFRCKVGMAPGEYRKLSASR